MARLPDDVWHTIIENLQNYQLDEDSCEWYLHDVDDLKSLRLTCKRLAPLASKLVFAVLCLRPNIGSLNRALQIGQHPELRHCVQKLELRPETVFANEEAAREQFKKNHRSWQNCSEADFEPFSQTRGELTEEEESYQSMDERATLVSLCGHFPNLKHILKVGNEAFTKFAAKYGLSKSLRCRSSAFATILAMSEGENVTSLAWSTRLGWSGPAWSEFVHHFDSLQAPATRLSKIRRLKLHFQIARSGSPPTWAKKNKAFRLFLQGLDAIEHLDLRLSKSSGCSGPDSGKKHMSLPAWDALFNQRWAHVHTLVLRGPITCEGKLIRFISAHRRTLRILTFHDLMLHRCPDPNEPPNSIMRFIWSLPRIAFLDYFQLEGDIRSCGTEKWAAEHPWDRDSTMNPILDRLERYVCGETPFPLPELPVAQSYEHTLSTWEIPIIRSSEELMALEELLPADISPEMVEQCVEKSQWERTVKGLDDFKERGRLDSSWKYLPPARQYSINSVMELEQVLTQAIVESGYEDAGVSTLVGHVFQQIASAVSPP
jgi:hypothetical protein